MYTKQELTHADAAAIIEAIRQKADAESKGLAAAVVDSHGELIAFLRTDGCRLTSIMIAQNKAYTAAREEIETAELGKRFRDGSSSITNFGELRYVSWDGGIPIFVDGNCVGAVGVSGLPGAEDVMYAKHGISAIGIS